MNKLTFIVMCFFFSVSLSAETVYKNTNPDGSVVFTDQPSTDSEEVKIRKPTTYKPLNLPPVRLPTKKLSPTFEYTVTIKKPAIDAVITDNINLEVSVLVEPALKKNFGHQILYKLGGNSKQSEELTTVFKNIPRGDHNLSVRIINRKGEVISPAASSSFHMKRFFKKPAKPAPKKKVP